jgi:hypothetical protein
MPKQRWGCQTPHEVFQALCTVFQLVLESAISFGLKLKRTEVSCPIVLPVGLHKLETRP